MTGRSWSSSLRLVSIDDSTKPATQVKRVVARGETAAKVELKQEDALLIDDLSDRLESLQVLRGGDDAGTEALLEAFGSSGEIEDEMLKQLSSKVPLRHPSRFDEAHRRAMRALEVFDRNGPRQPSGLKLPKPLKPVAKRIVQILITVIVRRFQKRLISSLRQLYALREANAAVGSDDYQMLATARIQVDAVIPDLNKTTLPLPAFLVGGAAISGSLSIIGDSLTSDVGRFCFAAGFLIVGLGVFWCVLKAAGIARSRGHIAIDASFQALWEVIGDAGSPPKDQARMFAVVATILLLAIWIVVPGVIAYSLLR
jgi:hypothetical protein